MLTHRINSCSKQTATLNDLTGLGNLTSVGSDFQITAPGDDQASALKTLSGPHNLENVRGSLGIGAHQDLTDIAALHKVTTVFGSLGIWENPSLSGLAGLENPTSIGTDLGITVGPVS